MNGHAIDTFSILWANLKFYVFCPFSLIGASISKIKREMAARIMIKPWWVTQFWFPMMVPHLQDFSVVLPPNILTLSFNKGLQHPLHPKMKLQAVQLLGKPSDTHNFHHKLLKVSWNCGEHQQGPDMSHCLKNDTAMQYQRMKMPILQM